MEVFDTWAYSVSTQVSAAGFMRHSKTENISKGKGGKGGRKKKKGEKKKKKKKDVSLTWLHFLIDNLFLGLLFCHHDFLSIEQQPVQSL